jgi:hypothetical protein
MRDIYCGQQAVLPSPVSDAQVQTPSDAAIGCCPVILCSGYESFLVSFKDPID